LNLKGQGSLNLKKKYQATDWEIISCRLIPLKTPVSFCWTVPLRAAYTLMVFNFSQCSGGCIGAGADTALALKVRCNSGFCFATLSSRFLRSKDKAKPNIGGFYFKKYKISWGFIGVFPRFQDIIKFENIYFLKNLLLKLFPKHELYKNDM
jgi:hypothetical protein